MFSSTLESLSIDAYIRRTLSTKLTNIIDYSPCLTELYISAFGITLKLDEVLASFPALKTIGIQHSDLRLGKNFPECPTNHGLTKIIAISVWTDVRTHNRLSLQCRQSNYLCFKGVRVEGSVCPTTGRISIDMSFTHFAIFWLEDIQFTKKKQKCIHYWTRCIVSAQSKGTTNSRL
ncbi:hypothetical protein J3Q64DRAFT_1132678 [Phycomyces blakesleeanus]|uniref:Uncharacterized protein n=1 Tax=Phycomyces blakesleeanus TaxID=4837 RepID=A0ABR3AZB1_PHYBL